MTRWVIVTGVTRGIGSAIAARLVGDGYSVIGLGRDEARLRSWVSSVPTCIDGTPQGEYLSVDLEARTLESELLALLERIDKAHVVLPGLSQTPIVGLVNAAAISQGDRVDAIQDDEWAHSFAINVTAPMRLTRCLVPRLKLAVGASVVNISSPVAMFGSRKVSYASSKAALLGLTFALARDLGQHGIRVNALLPGPTITGMTSDWTCAKRTAIAERSLLKRLCEPEDVAGTVSFLLGADSAYITGAVLDVTGGQALTGL